jgi:hypothetical protein
MRVTSVPGVKLFGIIFAAGPVNSPALLQVGSQPGHGRANPADPARVQDVFFHIGGAAPGRATFSLVVNSSQVILDDIWAWRADHGRRVGRSRRSSLSWLAGRSRAARRSPRPVSGAMSGAPL